MMTMSAFSSVLAVFVFVFGMFYACLTDLTAMKIRNGLVLLLLIAYLALAPSIGFSANEIASSAAIGLAVLVCAFLFFALGWIGGGDAKFAAVTALWFGVDHTMSFLIGTALLGGVFTLAMLQFRLAALPVVLQSRSWVARLHSPASGVPYGVPMSLAALAVFPGTPWMTTLF